jgi:drug/metabolite transporter (DMT)-like permease
MTERGKGLLAIIITVLFWGFSFISIKVAVAVLPPMTLGAARFLLAVLILYLVKRRGAPSEKLSAADLPYLIARV